MPSEHTVKILAPPSPHMHSENFVTLHAVHVLFLAGGTAGGGGEGGGEGDESSSRDRVGASPFAAGTDSLTECFLK